MRRQAQFQMLYPESIMISEWKLELLQDLWDEREAAQLDEPERLRYRSNLLGADLRITNFGGGNTSAKLTLSDPLTYEPAAVLWVKGSGGDLGSIKRSGFATLYLDKLHALEARYRGSEHEDEMVGYYPLCTFGLNPVAASIDTPLHGFLPFAHVDHLHPDWGIALAASANGRERMQEFNRRFERHLVWLPWQRPGFELGLMLRRAVETNSGCDGIVLGGHGLFTWGETARDCYRQTLLTIDQLGRYLHSFPNYAAGQRFGGARHAALPERRNLAQALLPLLRGRLSGRQPLIGHFSDSPAALEFVNSREAPQLAALGTSCPDHFVRTKIRPLYLEWQLANTLEAVDFADLERRLDEALAAYRRDYEEYYRRFAVADSPAMRDANPTVVLLPGVGVFSFGRSKPEARRTGEFYLNAIEVMAGASALAEAGESQSAEKAANNGEALPQAGAAAPASAFAVHANYVALPLSEAFRIEYWPLEEAKLRRMPPEKEWSRRVALVMGGGSGIGHETARLLAERGAHVVVADRDRTSAEATAQELAATAGAEAVRAEAADLTDRLAVRDLLRRAAESFGGLDLVINTAAVFPASPDGRISDAQWRQALELNVWANYMLADELASFWKRQAMPAVLMLVGSANAVVPKTGSEAYDVSKAAVNHLVRELAIGLAPRVRVNAIAPATVVEGSTMFGRERVLASLAKYKLPHTREETDEVLRARLAEFYAGRTLLKRPVTPRDCAEALLFVASSRAACTTGHIFPVDAGLSEAFLR